MAVPITGQSIESALNSPSTESKTTSLEFITVSNPKDVLTASNQHRIRRHARKSVLHAGRWRRNVFSRTFELPPIPSLPSNPFISNVGYYSTDDPLSVVPVHGLDNRSHFPVQTTTRMRELVSFIYNPTFSSWFRIALTDPCAFYMTLSNAALELARLHKGESGDLLGEDNEALSLYNLSLQNVQRRLQDPSDGDALGGILGFACRDVRSNFTRSTTHLRGLGQVLDAREMLLAQTTTDFRIMLMDSFAQDTSPLFPALDPYQNVFDHYLSTSSPALDVILQLWLDGFPGDADIISAFRWVAALTIFVEENSSMPQFWMDDKVTHMTLVVMHRLLSLKRYDLSSKTGPELEEREVIRLALIVFLGSLKNRLGFTHGGNAAFYCKRFKSLTDRHLAWSVLLDLQLWTVVVCGIEQSQPAAAQEWYSHQIASIMLRMGLRDWSSAMSIVRGLVWIDDLASDRIETLGAATENKLEELIDGSSYPI
ncbi:hypothetical protein B7494_g427 [Chlorociboria aeruginascens]|nr:hypothetical protein B7494_g427 [Chlorociboria aeruginascens]